METQQRVAGGHRLGYRCCRGIRPCGVRYQGRDGRYALRAALVVGADGCFSRLRKLAGLQPVKTSPPIDILWCRLARREDDQFSRLGARVRNGLFLINIDHFDDWQIGCVVPKGTYQESRAVGLAHFRQSLVEAAPGMCQNSVLGSPSQD